MRATVKQSTSSRLRAAYTLTECYDGERRANDLLDELQREHPLSLMDAALTAELTLGVMRHRITCEHLAANYYRGRWEGLRPSLRVILALGVYQLCWLDRIPVHAAVDETVKLAGRHGKGAASTTNAILRKIADTRGELIDRPNDADPCRFLPTEPNRGRLFTEAVFPDPTRRPLEHLIAITGHPAYLVERWHRRFKPKLARQICDAGARRPDLVLRANRMKTTPADLLARFVTAGHVARMIEGTDAICIAGHPAVTEIREFVDGLCQPQDSTAQLAVTLAAPRPGEFVVDLCAGVGTKSTQSAELMGNEGLVIAADIDAAKLRRAEENAVRLGLSIVRTVPVEGLSSAMSEMARPPDVILVDAPCSNTGVLARRPEARYRASQKSIASLIALQREIFAQTTAHAGPTTRIVYSTCSLEEEENYRQVDWFVSQNPTWHVASKQLIFPDLDRDGGFTALLTQA